MCKNQQKIAKTQQNFAKNCVPTQKISTASPTSPSFCISAGGRNQENVYFKYLHWWQLAWPPPILGPEGCPRTEGGREGRKLILHVFFLFLQTTARPFKPNQNNMKNSVQENIKKSIRFLRNGKKILNKTKQNFKNSKTYQNIPKKYQKVPSINKK